MKSSDDCWKCCKKQWTDYEPYGTTGREEHFDCSEGCKHYVPLRGDLGYDWGVCLNPESRRCGLLTFEHQGCPYFEHNKV